MPCEPHNITFDDKSPLFHYLPSKDGPSNVSWSIAVGQAGYREQHYTTYLTGASVMFEWTGTAVWLYGSGNVTAYEIVTSWASGTVLGVGTPDTGGLLFSEPNLPYGPYSVTLVVHQENPLSVIRGNVLKLSIIHRTRQNTQ
ncbi:uncharacterized protein B0H18DRAFT_71992 [Fomitopsis serialis]|uniref:uncharacterized protein n=1 Tax=Fomitopsis serialis TaxID=139415 RepID=UPI002007963B|nr:uncharacterized protein B0H18DRAFT_71992 [Neoantrodia serialis]KAH9931965.1 hypothetical protein B0H18DRAFT_71992 [Neoantrodia serialis]